MFAVILCSIHVPPCAPTDANISVPILQGSGKIKQRSHNRTMILPDSNVGRGRRGKNLLHSCGQRGNPLRRRPPLISRRYVVAYERRLSCRRHPPPEGASAAIRPLPLGRFAPVCGTQETVERARLAKMPLHHAPWSPPRCPRCFNLCVSRRRCSQFGRGVSLGAKTNFPKKSKYCFNC